VPHYALRAGWPFAIREAPYMEAPDVRTGTPALRRRRRRLPTRAERRVTYALKVLATVALAIYLLVGVLNFFAAIRTTGMLVVGAVLAAYLVSPLVRRLNERLPLVWSLTIVYLCAALVIGFALGLLVPALGIEVQAFAKSLPSLVAKMQHELLQPTNALLLRVPPDLRALVANLPQQFGAVIQTYGLDTLQKTLAVVLSAISVFAAAIVIPVLAAYLLLDAVNIRRQFLELFPPRVQGRVDVLIDDLDGAIGGFIRGQLIDGAIVGVMIFVMLTFMHVPYALLIGVAAGLLNFIPYAGAVIGFIPSVILALVYNGPTNALIVAGLFAVIQQIDGNFVAPRVLKDNVGLSPVYIILAILIGSELFGIVGTFLAVPVAAMIRVLREHLLPSYTPVPAKPVQAE
jgi:predicted PurR-regulated permease PerM